MCTEKLLLTLRILSLANCLLYAALYLEEKYGLDDALSGTISELKTLIKDLGSKK